MPPVNTRHAIQALQRTAPSVTVPASDLRLAPAMEGPRQPSPSLRFSSLGDSPRVVKSLLFFALALLFSASVIAGDGEPKTFHSLSDATKLLDRALVARDRKLLLDAFFPSAKTYFSEHPEVFEMLVAERKRTGALEKLYDGRAFPTDADTFKLGGHASELGHVHIDFVRDGANWKLKDIWNCR